MTDETREVLEVVKDMFSVLNGKMDEMGNRITNIENRLTNVENKVTKIEVTLENETNPRIKALYDGYISNSEKLDKLQPVVDDVKDIKMKTDVIELAVKSHSRDISHLKQVK